MFTADFFEWLTVLVMALIATAAVVFWLATMLYLYFDAKARSKNRAFSALLTVAVGLSNWPISFLAYLACTAILDRRSLGQSAG
jgi:hypothetical protein